MRRLIVAMAAAALAACGEAERTAPAVSAAPADPDAWAIDYARSTLGFEATQTGKAFRGRFEKFEANVRFDPDSLDETSIEVVIDMNSARTGDRQRDQALPTADWFHAREYPAARFVAREAVRVGPGAYEARGALSLRDATRDLVLPFTLAIEGDEAHARGGATILRQEFGVGRGEFATDEWVGFEVAVSFELYARRPG